jgi:predicted nucleic acid-binding protein
LTGIFIDSSFFIAYGNTRDRDHEKAVNLAEGIRNDEFGRIYTSDYVVDEALTTTLVRTRRMDKAADLGKIVLGYEEEEILPFARILHVEKEEFQRA